MGPGFFEAWCLRVRIFHTLKSCELKLSVNMGHSGGRGPVHDEKAGRTRPLKSLKDREVEARSRLPNKTRSKKT